MRSITDGGRIDVRSARIDRAKGGSGRIANYPPGFCGQGRSGPSLSERQVRGRRPLRQSFGFEADTGQVAVRSRTLVDVTEQAGFAQRPRLPGEASTTSLRVELAPELRMSTQMT